MSARPNKGAVGRQVVDWQHAWIRSGPRCASVKLKVETSGEQHVFEVQVYLNDLDPKAVRVELYADGVDGAGPVRQEMTRVRRQAGASGGYVYGAAVPATRPATDYTARVIPYCSGVAVPMEAARILWRD